MWDLRPVAMVNMKISVGSQRALKDMIELQMYLLAQSLQTPWPMHPRTKTTHVRGPRNPVSSSDAQELVNRGFIEPTSSRTYVVSKSGFKFYKQEMQPRS